MCYNGFGDEKDYSFPFKVYEEVATRGGVTEARIKLEKMYIDGIGVKQDK